MEFFQRAKVFRLKCSSQSKYLIARKDEETIKQSRDKSSNNARWSYELVKGKPNVIRLRSCCTWRYLAAVEDPFLLGMTGKKVVQTISQGPIIEWEPIKEGSYIKLKSHIGTTLRANRGPPPYRNSVTHDEPGHWTGTENMTMWIVDIIVIDYQSSEDSTTPMEEVKTTDPASLSCNVADQQVVLYPTISIKCKLRQNGSPTKVGPSSEQHSDSFNKLKSMLAGLDDLNDTVSKDPAQSNTVRIEPIEVKKAKQTIEQLKSTDFNTILSLGQDKKLEKAVGVLIADAKSVGQGEIQSKLINFQEQINSMKFDHESASQALINFSTFTARRLETRNELKKDAAKARELENVEVETNSRLLQVRANREELLKQLEETDNYIKDVEKAQADNVAEVDELISRIQHKSGTLKQMESQEKSWRVKKIEADRLLERAENDWGKIKNMFPDSTLVWNI